MLRRFEEYLFFLTILFLPTQLGKHFWPQFSYVYSLPIDYLSPTIYFWDLLVIFLILTYILRQPLVNKKALNLLFIFLLTQGISLLSVVLSPGINLGAGLVRVEQYFIAGLFGIYLASQNFQDLIKKIFWPLTIALSFECLLAILQFIKGGTVGFWILGERTFSLSTPAIAKFDFLGIQYLRPYATFPHPNTLASFIVITLPLLLLHRSKNQSALSLPLVLFLGGFATLLTVSRIALLVGLIELVSLIKSKWLIVVIIILILLSPFLYVRFSSILNFDGLSLLRRDDLLETSWQLFLSHPLFGVGLNNFIPFSADSFLVGPSRFLQPVHNVYLLLMSETGILGLLGFLGMVGYPVWRLSNFLFFNFQFSQKRGFASFSIIFLIWLSIFFLSFFDHYFLTQPQGIRLMFLTWGLTLSLISSKIA